jgi:indolepyruvate ferredoxin oxidoreductase, beta subunit
MAEFDLIIVGVGGQGAILASDIIGKAAIEDGLSVRSAETHGMAQRGGAVENHVRIGCKYGSLIPERGADCLMGMEPVEALRFAKYLKPKGVSVVNTRKIVPVTVTSGKATYPPVNEILEKLGGMCSKVKSEDYTDMAKQAGSVQAMNIAMIGAVSEYLPIKADTLKVVIERSVPPKTIAINLKAFEMGRKA